MYCFSIVICPFYQNISHNVLDLIMLPWFFTTLRFIQNRLSKLFVTVFRCFSIFISFQLSCHLIKIRITFQFNLVCYLVFERAWIPFCFGFKISLGSHVKGTKLQIYAFSVCIMNTVLVLLYSIIRYLCHIKQWIELPDSFI